MRVPNSLRIDKECVILVLPWYSSSRRKHQGNTKVQPSLSIVTESKTLTKKATFPGNTQVTPRDVTWMLPSVTWSTVYSVFIEFLRQITACELIQFHAKDFLKKINCHKCNILSLSCFQLFFFFVAVASYKSFTQLITTINFLILFDSDLRQL